jgi:CubicO group peptidase (beta-lactamase class C family)
VGSDPGLGVSMSQSAHHRPPPRPLDLLDVRLRPICDAYLGTRQVPGASIAIVLGDVSYHYAYGVKSTGSAEPVTAQTGFNIASCSKAFVSAAVASLVADGMATWDDPITRFVPEWQLQDPAATLQVTLRDMSANRLGLPRVGLMEAGLDPRLPAEHVFSGLRHTAPVHALRERFTYVNAGHNANAVAVGRITGQGFVDTVIDRILQPLGMSSSSCGEQARSALADQAAWHCRVGEEIVQIDSIFTDQQAGAGGMVVSGADALQWLRLHLNGGLVDGRQVISREALSETHKPHVVAEPGKDLPSLFYPGAHMAAYALGWAVSDFEGHPLICHSGTGYGVAAMTSLFPRSGLGIAVYANVLGAPVTSLSFALAATVLGLPVRDWRAYFESFAPALSAKLAASSSPAGPREPVDLASYVGTYVHAADGPLVVERAAEGLTGSLGHGYRMSFSLLPIDSNSFSLQFTQPEWRALMDGARAVLSFKVIDGASVAAQLDAGMITREFERLV